MAKVVQKVQKLIASTPVLLQKTQAAAKPKLQTFWQYARVEMRPPSPQEFPQVQQGFQDLVMAWRTQKWRNLTVKEGWRNTLVTVEVLCWFFVGEIIGRRHFIGYDA